MRGVLIGIGHGGLHASQRCQVVLVDFSRQLPYADENVRSEDQINCNEIGQSCEERLGVWTQWPRCASGKLRGGGRIKEASSSSSPFSSPDMASTSALPAEVGVRSNAEAGPPCSSMRRRLPLATIASRSASCAATAAGAITGSSMCTKNNLFFRGSYSWHP